MNTRFERLKFAMNLDFKMRAEKNLDKVFHSADFMIEFNNFLPTEEGQKWLKSEFGHRFVEWQNT